MRSRLFLMGFAVVVALAAAFLVFSPRLWHPGPHYESFPPELEDEPVGTYLYPLHVDGWNHVSQAETVVEEGGLIDYNPQLASTPRHPQTEQGFHVLLASLAILSGSSVLALAPFLPALFFLLGASLCLVFFWRVLRRPVAGILAVVLLALMPSNANILGPWFLVPLNLSPAFLFGFLLVLFLVRDWRWRLGSALALLAFSFWVYPPVMVLLLLVAACVLLVERWAWLGCLWRAEPVLSASASAVAVAAAALVIFFSGFGQLLVFRKGWTAIEYAYVLPDLVPWWLLAAAIAGLVFLYRRSASLFAFAASSSVVFAALTMSYLLWGVTWLLPYQRVLYFWQLVLLPVAAFGLCEAVRFLARRVPAVRVRRRVWVPLLFVLVFLLVGLRLQGYYVAEPSSFSVLLAAEDPLAVQVLLEDVPRGASVLADPFLAVTLYPLSGHRVVSAIPANLDGGVEGLFEEFSRSGCDGKRSLVVEYDVSHVVVRQPVSCSSLEFVRRESPYYLYVTSSSLGR